MASFKISMACWMVANERSSREKIQAANRFGVPVVTGGGPFEVAVACGQLDSYLHLCADMGVNSIEAGEGFTDMPLSPDVVMAKAKAVGLGVQFEMGKKHHGEFSEQVVGELIDQGKVDCVINVPRSYDEFGRPDGYMIRRRAVESDVPLITDLQLARALVEALRHCTADSLNLLALDEYLAEAERDSSGL